MYKSSKPSPESQRFAKSERFKKTVKKQYEFVIFVRFAQRTVVKKGGEVFFLVRLDVQVYIYICVAAF